VIDFIQPMKSGPIHKAGLAQVRYDQHINKDFTSSYAMVICHGWCTIIMVKYNK
jgi:hypothetical protein